MVYIIVFLAFILTWFFIEITLFLANKNFKSTSIVGVVENDIIRYSFSI